MSNIDLISKEAQKRIEEECRLSNIDMRYHMEQIVQLAAEEAYMKGFSDGFDFSAILTPKCKFRKEVM